MINIDFSDLHEIVNPIFYPLFWIKKRFLVLCGGKGSGKSSFAAQKVIKRIISETGHKIICFRKVARTIRHSVFAELLDCINRDYENLSGSFKVNRTDMTLTFTPNGNSILCFGMDNREKIKSLKGMTSSWVEEPTELTKEELIEINLQLRGYSKNYKQIILSFNPISIYHWLKEMFFDKADENIQIHHSTYKDNRWIDREYERELENLKDIDEQLYKIYGLGIWGQLKNIIYSNYVIEGFNYNEQRFDTEAYGLDFGYSRPASLLHGGFKDNDVYLTELIYQSHLTDDDLIELLKNEIPFSKRKLFIYADPSRPETIEDIYRAGFNICGADSRDVWEGILSVKERNIHIEKNSINIQKEKQSYKWRENKRTGEVMEEPVKIFDHAMDAERYLIHTHFKKYYGKRIIGKVYRVTSKRAGVY